MEKYRMENCTKQEKEHIYDGILAYNEKQGIFYEDMSFCIKDEQGEMIAGVVVIRKGKFIDLQYLWVQEEHRKEGLGSHILNEVEKRAKEKGATRVSIETFGFQAPKFYPRHGYTLFAEAKNCIGKHSRYYFTKEI